MSPARVLLAVTGTLILVGCSDAQRAADISTKVESRVESGLTGDATIDRDALRFYEARSFTPAWAADDAMDGAHRVVAWLQNAPDHGLPIPADLLALETDLAGLENEREPTVDRLTDLDVRLTAAALRLGHQIATGLADPARIDPRWKARRSPPALAAALAAADHDLERWTTLLQPQQPEYEALRQELIRTLALIDMPDNERLLRARVLALNMERWRWMPDDLGARHLFVNVPAFELRAREQGATVLTMRVVVGKRGRNETPVFSGELQTMVFSPTWNVPERIAREETLPALRKDASYLERQQMDVFRRTREGLKPVDAEEIDWDSVRDDAGFMFRQRPGAGNALGHVKFLFPNPFDVYLHDTPTASAFARPSRALSHGCVRVSEPGRLAAYVLRNQDAWDGAAIAKAMSAGRERHVKVGEPLPVHLAYFTAWPDQTGAVTIFDDVYGYDARQAHP